MLDGIASIAIPTIRSILSKSAGSAEQGLLFSSLALLECLIGIISPFIFGNLYRETVTWMPQLIFFVMSSFFASGFLLTFFIRNKDLIPVPTILVEHDHDVTEEAEPLLRKSIDEILEDTNLAAVVC